MVDPVTGDMVAAWAEDTLAEWLNKHYTDALADGHQRRVKLVETDDGYNVYAVRDVSGHHTERRFRVAVTVEEITNG